MIKYGDKKYKEVVLHEFKHVRQVEGKIKELSESGWIVIDIKYSATQPSSHFLLIVGQP